MDEGLMEEDVMLFDRIKPGIVKLAECNNPYEKYFIIKDMMDAVEGLEKRTLGKDNLIRFLRKHHKLPEE